jgi:predicted permease
MISFFLLSLPIFAVIGVGWAATRTRLVSQGALDALNAFSFRFALPALLLRLIAGQPLRQSFNPEFYAGYLASGAIIFVLVLGTSRLVASRDLSTAGAHATTATVSNLGFLGPPLMLAFFGERGAGPLAMAILAEVMVLFSVGSGGRNDNHSPLAYDSVQIRSSQSRLSSI